MKIKKLNNQGSILQIVLVLFLLITSCLSIYSYSMTLSTKTYQKINLLMKQKNLEILLCRYYLETMEDDILFGDIATYKNYEIQSDLEDYGSYFLIDTKVTYDDESYHFVLKLDEDYQTVLDFYYEGG